MIKAARPVLRSLAIMTLSLSCTSCFTMALWELEEEGDCVAGAADDRDRDDPLEEFLGRLMLTPLAIVLDVLTSPLQCACSVDDDR